MTPSPIVAVTRRLPDACEQRLKTASRYTVRLGDDDVVYTPDKIVQHAAGATALIVWTTEVVNADSYSGIGRIYRSERTTGCTGTPGYVVGTVDHAGVSRCPVHEASVREDLLR